MRLNFDEPLAHRTAAIGLAVALVTSLALMLHAARHQESILLILLFAAWVASPFLGLFYAHSSSKQWSPSVRATLYALTLAVVFICPGIYACVAFGYMNLKVGFVFLVVPLACWVLIGRSFLSRRSTVRLSRKSVN